MEPLVSVLEMRAVDKLSISELKIPAILLMENAGLKTAQTIRREYGDLTNKHVCIICGKGNNGGDGFVVGRHLSRMGASVEFFSTASLCDLRDEAASNRRIAENLGLPIHDIHLIEELNPSFAPDLIVDALLGTGIHGEVTGLYRAIIEWMNAQTVPIFAVDTPSGVNCETGEVAGAAVRARTRSPGSCSCLPPPSGPSSAGAPTSPCRRTNRKTPCEGQPPPTAAYSSEQNHEPALFQD